MKHWIDEYDNRDWRTDADGTIRYALVGLGWWTTDVAIPAIKDSDLGEVTVLVSSSTEKARQIAADNDIEHGISYEEYHDGALKDVYDAVYIGTPNACHLPYAETAAGLGKAVLCEKPMEATVERAEQLVESCEDADVPLMVAYRMHVDPAVRRARELVSASLEDSDFGTFDTLSSVLGHFNGAHLYAARRIRTHYADELSDDALETSLAKSTLKRRTIVSDGPTGCRRGFSKQPILLTQLSTSPNTITSW